MMDKAVVKVLAPQLHVSGYGFHLTDVIPNREQGHIERAATEVKDHDLPFSLHTALRFQAVGNRSRIWLSNGTHHREACNGACVLDSLPL